MDQQVKDTIETLMWAYYQCKRDAIKRNFYGLVFEEKHNALIRDLKQVADTCGVKFDESKIDTRGNY